MNNLWGQVSVGQCEEWSNRA